MEPLIRGRFGFAGPAPGPFLMKPVYRLEGVGWFRHVGWVMSVRRVSAKPCALPVTP